MIPENVIEAAQAAQDTTKSAALPGGIPASEQIAQWADESAWGTTYSGRFNCFGIKAVQGQDGTIKLTHEIVNGVSVAEDADFANFDSFTEAFNAHAMLLADEPQYAAARALLPNVTAFINAMAPVYATAGAAYAKTLNEIIAEHNLQQYDG